MKVLTVPLLCLFIHLCLAVDCPAETGEPFGGMLVPVRGNGAVNLLCCGGFIQETAWRGTGVLAESSRFLDTEAYWSASAYAGTHYLLLETGEWALVEENSATELFLGSLLQPAAELTYRIIPCNTLSSVFGEDNSSGLLGGSSLAEADILMPWNPRAQAYAGYYYFNTVRNRWEDLYNQPAGDCILLPDEAIVVVAREDREILLSGIVQVGASSGYLSGGGGTSVLPNPYPVDVPIRTCGLERYIQGGSTFAEADWVLDWNGQTQAYQNFYYYDSDEGLWRDLDNRPVGPEACIRAGTAVVVIRNDPLPEIWYMDPPFLLE